MCICIYTYIYIETSKIYVYIYCMSYTWIHVLKISISIYRLDKAALPYVDNIMTLLVKVLQINNTVYEEAFLAIGAVSDVAEGGFTKFVPALLPFVHKGVTSVSSFSLCNISIGLVGDISRAILTDLTPYADMLMTDLLQILTNRMANRFLKPSVIGVFNDIAMAIEKDFEKYVSAVMPLLIQAANVRTA